MSDRLWDHMEGESEQSWHEFQIYLKQSPRNMTEIAKIMGCASSGVYARAKQFRWKERVRAYDAHLQRAEDQVLLAGREQMAKEQLLVIRKARDIADKVLTRLLKALDEDPDGVGMSARDAITYLKESVILERLVIGEATDRIEQDFDMTKITGEEAEKMLEIMSKLS